MTETRRGFIGGVTAAIAGAMAPQVFAEEEKKPIRSALLHLSMNMWGEYVAPGEKKHPGLKYIRDKVVTDDELWRRITAQMQRRGYNHAIIDVGDAVVFPSHPELAIEGSWSADRLKDEVIRLKGMGIEAIPKLNFSTAHDGWLKEYGRMISTRKYYEVVKDLIDDACEIFGHPRHFHLGLDEEEFVHGAKLPMRIVRTGDFWWHDAHYYFDCVGKNGARPIVFGTTPYIESGEEAFLKNMPRSVIQNPAIYGSDFDESKLAGKTDKKSVRTRKRFDYVHAVVKGGYEIIGGTSAWVLKDAAKQIPQGRDYPLNHDSAAAFCAYLHKVVPAEQLLGMLSMPWEPMIPTRTYCWESGIDELADAMNRVW